jgi:hypothetical protein
MIIEYGMMMLASEEVAPGALCDLPHDGATGDPILERLGRAETDALLLSSARDCQ